MDNIIPEPLGGAHSDPMGSFPAIKEAVMGIYNSKCAPCPPSQACMHAHVPLQGLRRDLPGCRYANMDPEDIKLDRYSKFRKIGHYEEFLVRGGKWREARKLRQEVRTFSEIANNRQVSVDTARSRSAERACGGVQAKGAYTQAGTWAPNKEEAELIEAIVDRDERWEASLEGKEEWINRPFQPPGLLRSGGAPAPLKHRASPAIFGWLVAHINCHAGTLELAVALTEVSQRQSEVAQDAVAARRQAQLEAGKTVPSAVRRSPIFSPTWLRMCMNSCCMFTLLTCDVECRTATAMAVQSWKRRQTATATECTRK